MKLNMLHISVSTKLHSGLNMVYEHKGMNLGCIFYSGMLIPLRFHPTPQNLSMDIKPQCHLIQSMSSNQQCCDVKNVAFHHTCYILSI